MSQDNPEGNVGSVTEPKKPVTLANESSLNSSPRAGAKPSVSTTSRAGRFNVKDWATRN
jgi:hypothetical protein